MDKECEQCDMLIQNLQEAVDDIRKVKKLVLDVDDQNTDPVDQLIDLRSGVLAVIGSYY